MRVSRNKLPIKTILACKHKARACKNMLPIKTILTCKQKARPHRNMLPIKTILTCKHKARLCINMLHIKTNNISRSRIQSASTVSWKTAPTQNKFCYSYKSRQITSFIVRRTPFNECYVYFWMFIFSTVFSYSRVNLRWSSCLPFSVVQT